MTEYIVQVQKVLKNGLSGTDLTYSYGSPLRVGDLVMCPGNECGPFRAIVSALGSDYDGFVKSLLCRVAPDRKRP